MPKTKGRIKSVREIIKEKEHLYDINKCKTPKQLKELIDRACLIRKLMLDHYRKNDPWIREFYN